MYIVGIGKKESIAFEFPRGTGHGSWEDVWDEITECEHHLNRPETKLGQQILDREIRYCENRNIDWKNETRLINVDVWSEKHRTKCKGLWAMNLGRRLTETETVRMMGI